MKKLLTFSKPQRGFTLIELLIVIAIISVLIAIGAVSYSTIQRNARNDQRQSDMQKIAAALEEYYADNSGYPTDIYIGTGAVTSRCIKDSEAASTNCNHATHHIYLNPTPTDPANTSTQYGYAVSDNDTIINKPQRYDLSATREGTGPALEVKSPTH